MSRDSLNDVPDDQGGPTMPTDRSENPRPPMPPDEDLPGTCDWGYCDLLAKGWRFAADLNVWLPVCAKHRLTQSKIGRVRL